jgi:putative phosphoesterase
MRVAALYDIHGNLPALEAVIAEVSQLEVEQIVIGGDVVPGPMPCETLSYLRRLDLPLQFIQGNGEVAVLEERAGKDSGVPAQFRKGVRWNAEQLSAGGARFITTWPDTIVLQIDKLGEVLFCHATSRSKTEIFIRTTAEKKVLTAFTGVEQSIVICGHTHMQFDRTIGNQRVINAGSVGMPFGEPGAYWLILDQALELRCTPYNLEKAAERIQNTDYPGAGNFALQNVLHPPAEAQMLEAFAKAELQ